MHLWISSIPMSAAGLILLPHRHQAISNQHVYSLMNIDPGIMSYAAYTLHMQHIQITNATYHYITTIPITMVMGCWLHALTHWGRDKMATNSQTAFSGAFPWMKNFEFWIKFHWNISMGFNWHKYGSICSDNGLALNRQQAIIWTYVLLMHICVTLPQWVNTLRPE